MIQLKAERSTIDRVRADAVAMLVFEEAPLFRKQVARVRSLAGGSVPSFDDAFFAGKQRQSVVLYPPAMKGRALILVGAGKREALSAEMLRRSAARAAREAATLKATTLEILEPDVEIIIEGTRPVNDPLWENIGLALGEGAALAL
ncbi:hypothetical protein EHM92_02110 [bacterium]|nr:MAG: hypothetical protein EHM92_02110 [bacterium]